MQAYGTGAEYMCDTSIGIRWRNQMDRNAPIGVFDSGVGGLTVMREIMRQMPDELFAADHPFPADKRGEGDCNRLQYGISLRP